MKTYLPNILSLSRVVLTPVFVLLLLREGFLMQFSAGIVFGIAAVTDYFDGWSARRYRAFSRFGAAIDPFADKVLTSTAFVAFAMLDILMWWMVVLVIIRDVYMTLLRRYADKADVPLTTSKGAKMKTFAQMTFLVILILARVGEYIPIVANSATFFLTSWLVHCSMFIIMLITLWTAAQYTLVNKPLVRHFFS